MFDIREDQLGSFDDYQAERQQEIVELDDDDDKADFSRPAASSG